MEARRNREHPSNRQVPAEGNFEEHPYFRVGDRNSGEGVLTYSNELRTKDGNVLHQSWTVRAVHGRGLPGRFDQDVYVALLQMIDYRGLPEDGWLGFSLYELVELMGRGHSGRDYQQVRESLRRLASTSIESENAFYHRGRKEYITEDFNLLNEVKLSEYEDSRGERKDRNRVLLSEYFVQSYKANYLKDLDAPLYWSLSSPVAKRLYRLIDKKRNGRRIWEAELFSLKARIPLSDYKFVSKIKEKLFPAHAELIEKKFLEEVSYRKRGASEFATYKIADSFYRKRSSSSLEDPTDDEMFALQRLKAEGMSVDTAEQLVSCYGPDFVMHYVEALPRQKNLRNPAGWLRKAIESGYELDMPSPYFAGEPGSDKATENNGSPIELSAVPIASELRGADLEAESGVPDEPEPRPEPDRFAQELWENIVEEVAPEVGAASVSVWFEGVIPTALESNFLTVVFPNTYAKEYIESRFMELLEGSLRNQLGEEASLLVEARGE